jgi:hypothetical protein
MTPEEQRAAAAERERATAARDLAVEAEARRQGVTYPELFISLVPPNTTPATAAAAVASILRDYPGLAGPVVRQGTPPREVRPPFLPSVGADALRRLDPKDDLLRHVDYKI